MVSVRQVKRMGVSGSTARGAGTPLTRRAVGMEDACATKAATNARSVMRGFMGCGFFGVLFWIREAYLTTDYTDFYGLHEGICGLWVCVCRICGCLRGVFFRHELHEFSRIRRKGFLRHGGHEGGFWTEWGGMNRMEENRNRSYRRDGSYRRNRE